MAVAHLLLRTYRVWMFSMLLAISLLLVAPQPTRIAAQSAGLISNIVVSNGKIYQRDLLNIGRTVYIDRTYTFTAIPQPFQGAEYIVTANDDKMVTNDPFVSFTLAAPSTVYVAYDSRVGTGAVPAWLQSWVITGQSLTATDNNNTTQPRRIYARSFAAGLVTIPGNGAANNRNTYTIFAVPTMVIPTSTPTVTMVPPTATFTETPLPPTATFTETPVPPTVTVVPPTATFTETPVPPTATVVPPTATFTETSTPSGLPMLTGAPAELIFSTVKGTVSAAQSVVLTNAGTGDLQITGLTLIGTHTSSFTLLNPPTQPFTLTTGATLTLNIQFNPPSNLEGSLSAALRVTNNSPSTPTFDFGLYGLSLRGLEGNNEPPLHQVVTTLGHAINVGGTGLILGVNPAPIGAEVIAQLFQRASNGPVTLRPVARFSPNEQLPFGYYFPVTGGQPTLNQTAVIASGQFQTLNPAIVPGGTLSFDPGTAAFGIFVNSLSFNRRSYTQDSLNTGTPHAVRVYPLRDRSGTLIANSYLICFEDAANGDYQDYVFVLSNVTPATVITPTVTPVLPTATATQSAGSVVYRIDTGGNGLTASDGNVWTIDTFSNGGRWSSMPGSIEGTVDDLLYTTGRTSSSDLGNFSYNFPVTTGTYSVRLHFAETYFVGGTGRGPVGVGQRVFDVSIENTLLMDNYDITADVGPARATVKTFSAINVTDGTLNITFSASANRPIVSAIEILR